MVFDTTKKNPHILFTRSNGADYGIEEVFPTFGPSELEKMRITSKTLAMLSSMNNEAAIMPTYRLLILLIHH